MPHRHVIIVQAALATILVGLLVMAIGAAPHHSRPAPARSIRPATEQERREYERQRLLEEMDRLRASPFTPSP